jgi:hypothetical protein
MSITLFWKCDLNCPLLYGTIVGEAISNIPVMPRLLYPNAYHGHSLCNYIPILTQNQCASTWKVNINVSADHLSKELPLLLIYLMSRVKKGKISPLYKRFKSMFYGLYDSWNKLPCLTLDTYNFMTQIVQETACLCFI